MNFVGRWLLQFSQLTYFNNLDIQTKLVRSKALKESSSLLPCFHVYEHFFHHLHCSQIEPESQSQLLDDTMNMEGVLVDLMQFQARMLLKLGVRSMFLLC